MKTKTFAATEMAYTFKKRDPDGSQNPWRTRSIETAYENQWVRVSHRKVYNPKGNKGIYGVVHFKNVAVGVVPLDSEGNTWLVGQYRYTLKQYPWEIPEGGCPQAQDTLEAAKRELLEETGITARIWTPLLELHTSNSVTDEYGVAYIAQGLSFGEAKPEETELLKVKKLPFPAALDMVLSGEITDGLSMVSLLKVGEMIRRGELKV